MRFETQYSDLDLPALERLRQLAEMRWHRTSNQDQLVDCPVCGLPAYTEGDLEQVDWSVDFDRDGNPESAFPVLEFQATNLRCPSCGLVLDTASLISMSGAFENWELPWDDIVEYMKDWRDEERDWRD